MPFTLSPLPILQLRYEPANNLNFILNITETENLSSYKRGISAEGVDGYCSSP